jgi:hypothetical protein
MKRVYREREHGEMINAIAAICKSEIINEQASMNFQVSSESLDVVNCREFLRFPFMSRFHRQPGNATTSRKSDET